MRRLLTLLALSLAPLLGCDQEAMMEKFVPKEEASHAKEVIAMLIARDLQSVEAALAPSLRTDQLRGQLEEMARMLPIGQPKSVRTVGANTMTTPSHTTFDLSFEYEYPGAWIVANAVLERRDGKLVVQGLHFTPNRQSLGEMNRFTFTGKGALHYLVFALAIAIPALVVYALVLCIRTRPLPRKWLWILFIAFGLVQFRFNWSTGDWGVQPISVALLGAGFAKAGPVAPLVFTLAFPLGAVLFLAKRQRARPRGSA